MCNLLDDIDFINKRIKEQEEELSFLNLKYSVKDQRGKIMKESALSQLQYFKDAKERVELKDFIG